MRYARERIPELARFGNRYDDAGRPCVSRRTDAQACADVLFNCVQLIASLAALLTPFLPFSSAQVQQWLGTTAEWRPQAVAAGRPLPPISSCLSGLRPPKPVRARMAE